MSTKTNKADSHLICWFISVSILLSSQEGTHVARKTVGNSIHIYTSRNCLKHYTAVDNLIVSCQFF
jgi:hypothetical protein